MPDIREVFLYLIGCSLNGEAPAEELLADIDWAKLYTLAKRHSMLSTIAHVAEKTAAFDQASPEIKKAWREAREKAIRKTLIFDTQRAALLAEFEKQGIWYMPLKGIVVKDAYPHFGMREMGDNDILFDPEKRAQVRAIFQSRGYSVTDYNHTHHDSYEKAPVLCFEMHVMLFYPQVYPDLAAHYEHVKEKLIKDEGNAYGYHFSNEDLYVFMIAHAYKHYDHAGTGIRTLADMVIMDQRLGKTLDRAYVDRELASLQLLDYEKKAIALARRIFGQPALLSQIGLSEAERKELDRYLTASTYGTMENRVKNTLNKEGGAVGRITPWVKARYLLRRLFPGRAFCRVRYPAVYHFPVLLPFFWIWRLLFRATKNTSAIKKEYRALKKVK